MLKASSRGLQTTVKGATICTVTPRKIIALSRGLRWQSSLNTSKQESLSDEQVDEWLKAIKSLRAEFSEREFLPETSLAPPGQSRIDMFQEIASVKSKFEPTTEQIEEAQRVMASPLPQRRDPVVEHVVNMIMRHGKKQRAEKTLSRALYLAFCHIRVDPVQMLKKALDDLAPLMVVKTFNTGVAKAAVIPVPLNQRQRNRIAWKWIMEGADKRVSPDLSVRLGEELVAVYRGKSTGFDKRDQMHKTAIAHRAYIKLK